MWTNEKLAVHRMAHPFLKLTLKYIYSIHKLENREGLAGWIENQETTWCCDTGSLVAYARSFRWTESSQPIMMPRFMIILCKLSRYIKSISSAWTSQSRRLYEMCIKDWRMSCSIQFEFCCNDCFQPIVDHASSTHLCVIYRLVEYQFKQHSLHNLIDTNEHARAHTTNSVSSKRARHTYNRIWPNCAHHHCTPFTNPYVANWIGYLLFIFRCFVCCYSICFVFYLIPELTDQAPI